MKYKGYEAAVTFDDEAGIFHGEVINIRDVVTFQGKSVRELRKAMKDSVEDYLEYCDEIGVEPQRPFSGTFTVRVSPELHQKIYVTAKNSGKSLNAWVRDRLATGSE
ncbi:MAG: type II toxin-antitoxin system HicB family antitoxin [Candidatus Omnitrophica bacterium]|nr:type II toxin-antitoxin system HicB family antitoxin [Candidatus Omnitrophota bacterium]